MEKRSMEELNRLTVDEFKSAPKIPIILVLDNLRSQNNIGSIFRTADAFRIEALWLCGITATPPHREIHKTALGSTESVEWKYFPDTQEAIRLLVEKKYTVVAVEQAHRSIMLPSFSCKPDAPLALVFGNEVNGIDDGLLQNCSTIIEIPQFGSKHSFNVAVTVGIVLWDIITRNKFNPV